ncbi:MAG: type I DNA topoisomerase [Anaerolineae bacterium]|nr:type I DNA topoisomerase [Anaerolineae bacterium]
MAKKLLIVESPAKVKTIRSFLSDDFIVTASLGHVRDLPGRELGVDVANGFHIKYEILPGKTDIVKRLKGMVKGVDALYLATDPDREGEAIAWHLLELLKPRCPVYRVTFNTITEAAVKTALKSPRKLDIALVNAQQSRRIVDRLVGYGISPLLWGRFEGEGLSAGRVQTVGLRLVVEREREIQAFQPEAYWTLDADFEAQNGTFTASLVEWHGAEPGLKDETTARNIITVLRDAQFFIGKIEQAEKKRQPSPPFTTSTLQQAASTTLGFSPEKTMQLAQELYEGVDIAGTHHGLITYMRTDAVYIAPEAQTQAANFIQLEHGEDYLPPKPPQYKTRNQSAQEAHEAIRPTDVRRTPTQLQTLLSADLYQLYLLIWTRFLASQMTAARFAETIVMVQTKDQSARFRAKGRILHFDGFLRVYAHEEEADTEIERQQTQPLPELHENERLLLTAWNPSQHFTRPPGRYSEAALVQALEKHGIGRPSTYASTLSTLKARGYVEIGGQRKLNPTGRGMVICDFLTLQFSSLFAYDFTARLEDDLDAIAEGKANWIEVLRRFWGAVEPQLQAAEVVTQSVIRQNESTSELCPECGKALARRKGKNGLFIGCSGYPDCRYTRPLAEEKTQTPRIC